MAQQLPTVAGLALVSAILACFVPGVSDASGTSASAAVTSAQGLAGAVASGEIRVAIAVIRPAIVPIPVPASVSSVRRRMPVGCERAVSPLVKSAEASQIARCVT